MVFCSTSSDDVTSRAIAVAPRALRFFSVAAFRAVTITLSPCANAAKASARPMPEEQPVMSQTLGVEEEIGAAGDMMMVVVVVEDVDQSERDPK